MGYITVKKEAMAEFEDRKSVFQARIKPVQTEQEALDYLSYVRALDRTATHNCFAYRLRDRNVSRYSDDGEPSGTAGLPILDVLERKSIVDAVLVVTRWFGGTLLGTGGLVRAYSASAADAVEAAGLVRMELAGRYELACKYSDYDKILRIIEESGALLGECSFAEKITINYTADKPTAVVLEAAFRDATRGSAVPKLLEEGFLPL